MSYSSSGKALVSKTSQQQFDSVMGHYMGISIYDLVQSLVECNSIWKPLQGRYRKAMHSIGVATLVLKVIKERREVHSLLSPLILKENIMR